jgi:hypothetical protein
MIELAFLVILDRLVNWGLGPIIVTGTVAADDDALRGVLADPANQWRLAASFADVIALEPAGDRCDVQLRLLLGKRVHASVHVKPSRRGRLLTAEVRIGTRTIAWVTWILTAGRGTTEVDLAVKLESRSLATRLVMLLGGRRWIARRLETALATLATTSARVAEDVVAPPMAGFVPTPPPGAEQDSPVEACHAPTHP